MYYEYKLFRRVGKRRGESEKKGRGRVQEEIIKRVYFCRSKFHCRFSGLTKKKK